MKNTSLRLSEIMPDAVRSVLPQITQIAQRNICENLRNLRLKDHFHVFSIILLVMTSAVFFSCSNGNKDAQLKKADSLLQVVSVIDSTVAAYETDTARTRYAKIQEELDLIGKYMTDLPENRSYSVSLSEYANSSKGFKRFFKDIGGVLTENALSKSQLENLKKDISDNIISETETALYITDEENAVSLTFQKMKGLVEKYNSLCRKTSELKATVQLVIDSLKKVNKIQ